MTGRKSPRHADAASRTASSLQRGNHRAGLLPGARRCDPHIGQAFVESLVCLERGSEAEPPPAHDHEARPQRQRMVRASSDLPNVFARYWLGEHPSANPQACWRRSPVSLAGEIETPTLVLVGTEDHRTPPSEAEQLYQALQLRGVPAALLLIPGASHGGAFRSSQVIARLRAAFAWFERHGSSAAGGADGR